LAILSCPAVMTASPGTGRQLKSSTKTRLAAPGG
jgi:hypothetical protein